LRVVTRKFLDRAYADLLAFKADVNLAWQNCLDSNDSDSDAARRCLQLQAEFDETTGLLGRISDVDFLARLPLVQIDTAVGLLGKVYALISAAIVAGTLLSGTTIEFLLEFLQRLSETDKCPAVDAFSDPGLHDAIGSEACDSIITAVIAQILTASDPKLQEHIIQSMNLLITQDSVFIAPVVRLT
jgi:hypothetical protein